MNDNIDKTIENELENIKETRADERKKNRKAKYSNFAVRCLYKTNLKFKNSEISMIYHIIRKNEIYKDLIRLLYNCEYIVNRSYAAKYIAKRNNCSTSNVYDKMDELVELDVLEYIDKSVRITRLALRNIYNVELKTINYKKDSKERSKLRINIYEKGYRKSKQRAIEKATKMNLENNKILILNDREIVLLHKNYSKKEESNLNTIIYKVNKFMNQERFKNINQQRIEKGLEELSDAEMMEDWVEFEKVYVTNKIARKYEIFKGKTEILEDVIDYSEYKKK